MKKFLVGSSWKMNKTVTESIEYARQLINYLKKNENYLNDLNIDVFIIPTFLAIFSVSELAHNSTLQYGAQDCCWADEGAFTGEVSPMHLKDLGCTYAELGHAERRNIFKEDDEMVNKKIHGCLRNNLKPILCIGEEKRYARNRDAFRFVKKQILLDLKGVTQKDIGKIVIAYEPVWAIGAYASAPVDFIYEGMNFLRELIREEYDETASKSQLIIYGGSVTPKSAREILTLDNNNGIFIGRAALNLNYFIEMIEVAAEIAKNNR
jgi:triosephosphate isomerase